MGERKHSSVTRHTTYANEKEISGLGGPRRSPDLGHTPGAGQRRAQPVRGGGQGLEQPERPAPLGPGRGGRRPRLDGARAGRPRRRPTAPGAAGLLLDGPGGAIWLGLRSVVGLWGGQSFGCAPRAHGILQTLGGGRILLFSTKAPESGHFGGGGHTHVTISRSMIPSTFGQLLAPKKTKMPTCLTTSLPKIWLPPPRTKNCPPS